MVWIDCFPLKPDWQQDSQHSIIFSKNPTHFNNAVVWILPLTSNLRIHEYARVWVCTCVSLCVCKCNGRSVDANYQNLLIQQNPPNLLIQRYSCLSKCTQYISTFINSILPTKSLFLAFQRHSKGNNCSHYHRHFRVCFFFDSVRTQVFA